MKWGRPRRTNQRSLRPQRSARVRSSIRESLARRLGPMGDVLVTGGTGGLGAERVPRLLDAGHTVRITSRDASSSAPEGVTVHAVDLASGRGLTEAVAGVDTIVHAATAVRGAKKVEVAGAGHLLAAIGESRPHLLYVSI